MTTYKWRPSFRCVYVLGEIHGNAEGLLKFFDRILPLRKIRNQDDMLICLGDYIDGDEEGWKVIELLIDAKKEFGDRLVFLRGNHEDTALNAINGSHHNFNDWMASNGQTTINGYIKQYRPDANPNSISTSSIKDLIPKSHIDFLSSLETYYILDDCYFFMHGSFDPKKTIAENSLHTLIRDTTASRYVKDCLNKGSQPEFLDDYIFIGAHNHNSKVPFISQRYMMLGGGAPSTLYALELNSMTMMRHTRGSERIYTHKFKVFE